MDKKLRTVSSQVEVMSCEVDHLSQASGSPRPPLVTPPPPPIRRSGSALHVMSAFKRSAEKGAAPGGLARLHTVTGAEDLGGLRDNVAPRSLAVADDGEEPEPEPEPEEERLRP